MISNLKIQISNRRRGGRLAEALALVAALALLFPPPARAYGDVGTGILLWQLLLASFAGAMFYVRKLLRGRREAPKNRPEAEPPQQE